MKLLVSIFYDKNATFRYKKQDGRQWSTSLIKFIFRVLKTFPLDTPIESDSNEITVIEKKFEYLKNTIQPWFAKLNNSSYNNDAQDNAPIFQEKLVKFWQENKKKAINVRKNGSVWSNPVPPRINNKKTEEYFQAKYNHPKANLVEIVKSYSGLNTAEVPQFIPGEILKILKSCRLSSSCGKDGVFYKGLLDNWEVIQHEVTAICNVLVISDCVQETGHTL